jgi:hypothetical protein
MDFPTLPHNVQALNLHLRMTYGIDTESTMPMYRISWAPDQYEKRMENVTPTGIQLLHPILMELPKYPWVGPRWILEILVLVPEVNSNELAGLKKSYECLWKFEDRRKEPVDPEMWACEFIIDARRAAITGNPMNVRRYFDPDVGKNTMEQLEINKKRIDELVEQLFGDESSLLGRTVTGEAVAMPQNYVKEK